MGSLSGRPQAGPGAAAGGGGAAVPAAPVTRKASDRARWLKHIQISLSKPERAHSRTNRDHAGPKRDHPWPGNAQFMLEGPLTRAPLGGGLFRAPLSFSCNIF